MQTMKTMKTVMVSFILSFLIVIVFMAWAGIIALQWTINMALNIGDQMADEEEGN